MFSMLSLLGWKLSSDHDRRERGGSKEENQTDLLEYLFARKKGRGRGFLHMCITNIGQKNLSTNEGLQSNIHESTGLWQHGGGVVGGGGLGAGGRDGREDEQVGGETESERRGRHGQGFCVTKRQSGQISFYPQCTDSKECVLFPVFPPLFVRREV